jgi:hypothetical protein
MKKQLRVFVCMLALLCAPIPSNAQASDRLIPEGTELQLSLSEPLSSKLNDVGDIVMATVRRDVVVDGKMLLPRGAEVTGRVTLANPAGRPFKGGKLHVTFDRVRIDGMDQKLSVVVKSASDFNADTKVKTNSEGTLKEGTSGGDVLRNVGTAAGIGGIGVTIAILAGTRDNGGGYYGGWSQEAAIVGASILGASVVAGVLLTKGKEVRLGQGTVIRVKLERALTVL